MINKSVLASHYITSKLLHKIRIWQCKFLWIKGYDTPKLLEFCNLMIHKMRNSSILFPCKLYVYFISLRKHMKRALWLFLLETAFNSMPCNFSLIYFLSISTNEMMIWYSKYQFVYTFFQWTRDIIIRTNAVLKIKTFHKGLLYFLSSHIWFIVIQRSLWYRSFYIQCAFMHFLLQIKQRYRY